MTTDYINHTCTQCGDTYEREVDAKGQKASWCQSCRREYMRDYHRRHHVPVQPILGPKMPKGKWIACRICGLVVRGRKTMCGSTECMAESKRRYARARRKAKPAYHVKNKRQSDRNRRMRLRGVHSEAYDPIDIADRDGWKCSLCSKLISRVERHPHPRSLTMDHIIPVSVGGDDVPSNVRACHALCNSIKGNRVNGSGEQLMLVG